VARTAETQWGLMISVYCISHVPALLTLDIPGYKGRNAMLVIFLLIVVQSSDILQYVWGKLLGRHKIAPALSPSKTVEGFVGGTLSATGLGAALWRLAAFNVVEGGVVGGGGGSVGVAGGLGVVGSKGGRG